MRLGIHLYTFGSLEKAALRAAEIGLETMQIFTASPRMWRSGPADAGKAARFRALLKKHRIDPLVVHVNYLVNLASRDPVIRANSIATLSAEIQRADVVGAKYLVVHPGNRMDLSMEAAAIAAADAIVHAGGTEAPGVTLLLENTAGSGSAVGSQMEELRRIRDLAQPRTAMKIGYCLDTCHLHAAGFDIVTPRGLRQTLAHADHVLGLSRVRVFHANDSKTPFQSHTDRHAKIGEGHIGSEPFRRLLRHPRLQRAVFISETPVEEPGDDRRNFEVLKACRE